MMIDFPSDSNTAPTFPYVLQRPKSVKFT